MGKAAYDFAGWATRNNLKCADGRTIRANAFADQDGQVVPLVWNHQHNDPYNVLGHALLKNEKDGVRCYATFNDTEQGRNAKALVDSGDITSLSIFANQLKQKGGDVLHGAIREVSLVLAGANPGAYIDSVSFAHGEESEDEAIIYNEEELELAHADAEPEKKEEEKPMAEVEEKKAPAAESSDETVKDVFDTLNEKQKTVVYALIGEAIKQAKEGDEGEESDEEDEEMKHNIFEGAPAMDEDVLSHSDEEEIIELAKNPSVQTLKNAMLIFEDNNSLQHDAVASGFATADVSKLFPEYQDIRPGAPELITYDQGWVNSVMSKGHKSPISRVRTQQVDIRGIDALRAKGYVKGKEKRLAGNFNLVRRTTDPQTIYVRTNLNRDDIVDI
ncbi:MAG: HK97 family phage prohead protease, partial [Candidatus Cryptobacteroides sp.]|nr:HK97 family phage prohead protease [Candidatus Cryptobacteroides sp.]